MVLITLTARSRALISIAVVSVMTLLLLVVAPPVASADNHCSFTATPANAQYRGSTIRVVGSFNDGTTGLFGVILVTGWGGFGPEGQVLEPLGTTAQNGSFDHTVTIPANHPTGSFELLVGGGPGGLFDFRWCSISPYTVNALVVVLPPITTTSTLGLAPPTTTGSPPTTSATTPTTSPTTTLPAATTTATVPASPTSAPPPEESTTIAPEETSTTTEPSEEVDDEDILAGDVVRDSGIPLWLIALVVVMALALMGLGGYLFGMRGRTGGVVPLSPRESEPPSGPDS